MTLDEIERFLESDGRGPELSCQAFHATRPLRLTSGHWLDARAGSGPSVLGRSLIPMADLHYGAKPPKAYPPLPAGPASVLVCSEFYGRIDLDRDDVETDDEDATWPWSQEYVFKYPDGTLTLHSTAHTTLRHMLFMSCDLHESPNAFLDRDMPGGPL